ncbi:effector-associated domain 2-containing protein [Streptomyces sp. NPDC003860]
MAVDEGERAGRLRVLSAGGGVLGAGILVGSGTVLTCAHVVSADGSHGAEAERSLRVDAPGGPRVPSGAAHVVPGGWFPGPLAGGAGGDLAVLRTDWAPPDGLAPARLGPCGEPDRREVQVYGHPAGAVDGLWAQVRLAGRGGPHREWVQLEGSQAHGARIEHGFSGAGVWDPVARRVIGMVTAAYTDRQAKVAWMLPIEAAARLWPDLAPLLAPPDGIAGAPHPAQRTAHRARLPSDRDQFALADALLRVPQVEEDGAAALRRLLPPRIRGAIRTSSRPRLQVFYLVQGCVDHRDGRRALVDALRLLDDASAPAQCALELFDELWPAAAEGGAP